MHKCQQGIRVELGVSGYEEWPNFEVDMNARAIGFDLEPEAMGCQLGSWSMKYGILVSIHCSD